MKILMVNKFLYPNGGSETYIFKLGREFERLGHRVEYFGMEDGRNIVGNSYGLYTPNKDFRTKFSASKIFYPFEIIYSLSAKKKMARLLDAFCPDVVHLNNINFQITPSVIYEIKKRNIKMVWTAHDYQTVCPNHSLYIHDKGRICEECLSGGYHACIKNKCLHGSFAKSVIAAAEAYFYKALGTYRYVSTIICPSGFMAEKLRTRQEFAKKCIVMHNFIDKPTPKEKEKGDYVLYFGRYDREKGIKTLISACRELPEISFVFAGAGELEEEINGVKNIKNAGFVTGGELERLIRGALFTIYPSEWYENCPFSIMESQTYGVPVLGADIGGIPELVKDGAGGVLFKSGDREDLKEKIKDLYNAPESISRLGSSCASLKYDTVCEYAKKLEDIYRN